MAEAKEKLKALQTRTGDYEGLPDKVFINGAEDYTKIQMYGFNRGEDDPAVISELTEAGWDSENWFVSSDKYKLEDNYIEGLYTVQPSTHCLWPIWQTFIDKSNTMLNNDGNYGQLSD
jgi:hypothetical protein